MKFMVSMPCLNEVCTDEYFSRHCLEQFERGLREKFGDDNVTAVGKPGYFLVDIAPENAHLASGSIAIQPPIRVEFIDAHLVVDHPALTPGTAETKGIMSFDSSYSSDRGTEDWKGVVDRFKGKHLKATVLPAEELIKILEEQGLKNKMDGSGDYVSEEEGFSCLGVMRDLCSQEINIEEAEDKKYYDYEGEYYWGWKKEWFVPGSFKGEE